MKKKKKKTQSIFFGGRTQSKLQKFKYIVWIHENQGLRDQTKENVIFVDSVT